MSKLGIYIKTIDAKSMLIGFLLCAVGFLTMGASELGNGIRNVDGVLYVKSLMVIEDINNAYKGDYVRISPTGIYMEGNDGEYMSDLTNLYLKLSHKDKRSLYLVTTDNGTGGITTYNKFGNEVTALGVTKDHDGGVFLYDRYGDFGHSVTGKK